MFRLAGPSDKTVFRVIKRIKKCLDKYVCGGIDFSKFLLVEYQGEIVGGTVCVFDDETVYEWFACGKDGMFKNIFPSTLATWAGIRFAAQTDHQRFDMMGAGAPGDKGYGVRDFKAKFGGELVEYGRFKCILNKPLYSIGKLGVKLMKMR